MLDGLYRLELEWINWLKLVFRCAQRSLQLRLECALFVVRVILQQVILAALFVVWMPRNSVSVLLVKWIT